MIKSGNARAWDGPIEQTPWWWPRLIQIEARLESLRETAAYDPDKKTPPKELWPLAKSDELERDWLEPRREESSRRLREKASLPTW